MSLWGGRFSEPSAAEFKQFNDSLSFDYVLAPFDIQASKAWAQALLQAQLLSADENQQLQNALNELAAAVATNPQLPLQTNEEDVHSWVEAQLIEKIGATAKKLHTGRSRNDLVATDLRLFCKNFAQQLVTTNLAVVQALLNFAEQHQQSLLPGYTHLQRAQPIVAGHWALAYVNMLQRDVSRLPQPDPLVEQCAVRPSTHTRRRAHLSQLQLFQVPPERLS